MDIFEIKSLKFYSFTKMLNVFIIIKHLKMSIKVYFLFFFQDTLVMTEEQLDVSLAKVCMGFDTMTYAKIQVKYDLISF